MQGVQKVPGQHYNFKNKKVSRKLEYHEFRNFSTYLSTGDLRFDFDRGLQDYCKVKSIY